MDKLEQVSENPELKQEMEAEVASTNSKQVIKFPSLIIYTVETITAICTQENLMV